jgi:tetratricopeptide (TPR) repeat protein/predicted aspartyl protease
MAARRLPIAALLVSLTAIPLSGFAAGCKITAVAPLPVTMSGMRPIVTAKINGVDAQFVADSGAFFSIISPASAAEYKLATAPSNIVLAGLGGARNASLTTVREFTLAGVPIHNVQFVVGGSQIVGAVGLLGQNVFLLGDVEYDLSHGAIRLIKTEGCGKSVMVYWAKDGEAYSVLDIAKATASSPHTTGLAFLNGSKLEVLFDTGADTSLLTLRAAARAGVTPETPGVVKAGLSGGIGERGVQTWIGSFDNFKIGDEEIQHTRLRFGDVSLPNADMLIGADFFLSHRVYVATGQRKLYFTYNGGPVFDLRTGPRGGAAVAASTTPAEPAATAAAAPTADAAALGDADASATGEAPTAPTQANAPPIPADQPKDAAGFSRRGAAYAARRDFAHAIEDFTRASELAPMEPEYFYQRAQARLGTRQPMLALDDLNRAIDLQPDYVPALLTRAGLRLSMRGPAEGASGEILADLDKVNATVAKEADARLALGNLYARAGALEQAIGQYDVWLDKHLREIRTPDVLASRCRAKAMLGEGLDKALSDCNRAVKERPQAVVYLGSRGLVYLRMGDYDKALKDFDAVLAAQPKNPWALYGRGLAKLRKGQADEGQADIVASKLVNPAVADEAARRGLAP